MSDGVWFRRSKPDDLPAIIELNDLAFGGQDESAIVRRLWDDGDSLLSLVAVDGQDIIGHIEFFRILIDGAPLAAGLGPMSVRSGLQKKGAGAAMIRLGLIALEGAGERIVFVLGHDTYYPKFGFTEAAARPFSAAWSGPHFMALRLASGAPQTGVLTYPDAFSG